MHATAWTAGRHAPMNSISRFVNDRSWHPDTTDASAAAAAVSDTSAARKKFIVRHFDFFVVEMLKFGAVLSFNQGWKATKKT